MINWFFAKNKSNSILSTVLQNNSDQNVSYNINSLTKTELRVLSLLAEGLEYKDICEKMFIGKRTVYFHVQNIKNKLDLHSTNHLRKYAIDSREQMQKVHEQEIIDNNNDTKIRLQ